MIPVSSVAPETAAGRPGVFVGVQNAPLQAARKVATAVSSPFASLRARLVLAFAAVAGLALLLAGAATALVVRDYRTRIAVDHLSDLAIISAFTARQLEQQSVPPDTIAAFLASQVRAEADTVLIVDQSGRVVADRRGSDDDGDDDGRLVGRMIAIPTDAESAPAPAFIEFSVLGRRVEMRPFSVAATDRGWGLGGTRARLGPVVPSTIVWEATADLGTPVMMVTIDPSGPAGPDIETLRAMRARQQPGPGRASPRPPPAAAWPMPAPEPARAIPPSRYRVVLATPSRNVQSAWRDLAPRLSVAAAIALAISLTVAVSIAASIGGGIGRINVAARRISRGDLHARVPVSGHDEIATLGHSFNVMAAEVARSQGALRNFVADASHELRTPLTSIQGFAAALLDGALPGEDGAMRAGAVIAEEASRMRTLVEDLLYLSKVEALGTEPRRDPLDLDAIARGAIRRLGHLAEARDQHFETTFGRVPALSGDPQQVDLLVTNLIENAIKYAPEGATISVEVGTVRGATSSTGFVSVHNTGSTIPPEDLPHIFERFYRVDKSRSRGTQGNGLGLAIALEVARRHGGDIEARSSATAGTTFTARLASPVAT